MSVHEIAQQAERSFEYIRKRLLRSGAKMRTKGQGAALSRERNGWRWSPQEPRFKVSGIGTLTDDKVLLLTLVITEGHRFHYVVGFTNTQEMLHEQFKNTFRLVYGDIPIRRYGIQAVASSVVVAREVESLTPGKVFSDSVLEYILRSATLSKMVLRIVAGTEGSMILAAKRAPHNFTVKHRTVLASSNPRFTEQVAMILRHIGIGSSINRIGVQIIRTNDVARFISEVGFTPGVRVIRKKAGYGIWYGKDKSIICQVFLRVAQEQERAWRRPSAGVFADCKTREETVERLMSIYRQVSGG